MRWCAVAVAGFAGWGCGVFKAFGGLVLVHGAQVALFSIAQCLTLRSSRPAFCGPLILSVSQSTGEYVFRILLIALLAFGVWKGYEKYQSQRPAQQFQEIDISSGSSRRNRSIDLTPKFQCDGRTHCSQMTSCEEATFFLKNCPGTKMDGNNDGVPCEQQWCK